MMGIVEQAAGFWGEYAGQRAHGREWVNALRAKGMEEFRRQGFPTTRQEEWRDTNVSGIARTAFGAARPARVDEAVRELFERFTFGGAAAAELVFVNGHFEEALSVARGLPAGVTVLPLGQAIETQGAVVQEYLARLAKMGEHPFAALNTAFVGEGAYVHVGASAVCEKPIHLVFLTTVPHGSAPLVSHPRVLVVAEAASESSIVETYAGGNGVAYLTNGVTEIIQAPTARIDHNKLQQEGDQADHIALMQVVLATESAFVSHSTSMGSQLTRNDLQVFLGGERAEATLNGLVYAHGDQHIDNHTLLHHEKAHCPSHELYKYVLAERSTGIFKGKIFVQKDAQKTDSKQTSKSLLLSNEAFMNSQPALEIYADDVKCTHGSTTGPVDENAVFYLISRGLSLAQARHLMTYAFAADITRRIKVTPVRARIEDYMAAQHGLPQDLRITETAASDVALL
jgi:Fe-S cluster assembly protein SufD